MDVGVDMDIFNVWKGLFGVSGELGSMTKYLFQKYQGLGLYRSS